MNNSTICSISSFIGVPTSAMLRGEENPVVEAASLRLLGTPPIRFDDAGRPRDVEEGYATQDCVWRQRGLETAGYKIGLTTAAGQAAMGSKGPVAGRLGPGRILRGFSRIPVATDHLRIIEPELVFIFKSDLIREGGALTAEDVHAAIGSVHAGIEVCNSRYDRNVEPSLAELVADNVNADWLVIGDRLVDASPAALAATPVRVSCSGMQDVEGSTSHVLGDPLEAVLWLARHLAARGEALRAGMLVASGSCAGMIEVPPSEVVVVQFGNSALAATRLVAK